MSQTILPGSVSRLLLVLAATFLASAASSARAEKIWTSSTSGRWSDGTNWSGGTPPDVTSFIRITNDSSKTITIDGTTPATNLTAQMLTLSAPPGATNLLLLNGTGVTNPLVFQTGLELQDGAAIRITNSALQTLLTNDHINIDGSLTLDSGLIDFGDTTVTARVGRVTSGVFTINGGLVSAGTITVGGLTKSTGTLNLNSGTLNVAALLSVGRNLGTTGTVSVAGGQLNVANDDTRVGDGGFGQMTVSNANVWLLNLQVGRDIGGTLVVGAGSTIQVLSAIQVGRFTGATGTVSVLGGSLQAPGQNIFVGRGGQGQLWLEGGLVGGANLLVAADTTNSIGGSGSVTVSGGMLWLSTNLAVGSVSYASGQVAVMGGAVAVTNSAQSATLNASSGTFWLNGGNVTTDGLLLTNAAGQFTFSTGFLSTRATTAANGSPFVVGDGVHPAILYLNGGTHSFVNGLVISSNATLAGCATVLGPVSNHGTIATNCSPPLPARLSWQSRVGTTNLFSFPSRQGSLYTLQNKQTLGDAYWSDVGLPVVGNGSTLLLPDTSAGGASRFYRLKVQ